MESFMARITNPHLQAACARHDNHLIPEGSHVVRNTTANRISDPKGIEYQIKMNSLPRPEVSGGKGRGWGFPQPLKRFQNGSSNREFGLMYSFRLE